MSKSRGYVDFVGLDGEIESRMVSGWDVTREAPPEYYELAVLPESPKVFNPDTKLPVLRKRTFKRVGNEYTRSMNYVEWIYMEEVVK